MNCILETANAKLNLALRVTGRREDGYHYLSMFNVLIDLCDHIELMKAKSEDLLSVSLSEVLEARLSLTEKAVLCSQQGNIVIKALKLFREVSGVRDRVEIKIKKNIPLGGGLGGGSSDAAAVLRALLKLFQEYDLSRSVSDTLNMQSVKIGADIPFFIIESRAAVVEGIGEILQPLSDNWLSGHEVVLIIPEVACSTPEVYRIFRKLVSLPQSQKLNISDLKILKGSPVDLRGLLVNDLLAASLEVAPAIKPLYQELINFEDLAVGMTGSGSTLFAMNRGAAEISAIQANSLLEVSGRYGALCLRARIL